VVLQVDGKGIGGQGLYVFKIILIPLLCTQKGMTRVNAYTQLCVGPYHFYELAGPMEGVGIRGELGVDGDTVGAGHLRKAVACLFGQPHSHPLILGVGKPVGEETDHVLCTPFPGLLEGILQETERELSIGRVFVQ